MYFNVTGDFSDLVPATGDPRRAYSSFRVYVQSKFSIHVNVPTADVLPLNRLC